MLRHIAAQERFVKWRVVCRVSRVVVESMSVQSRLLRLVCSGQGHTGCVTLQESGSHWMRHVVGPSRTGYVTLRLRSHASCVCACVQVRRRCVFQGRQHQRASEMDGHFQRVHDGFKLDASCKALRPSASQCYRGCENRDVTRGEQCEPGVPEMGAFRARRHSQHTKLRREALPRKLLFRKRQKTCWNA